MYWNKQKLEEYKKRKPELEFKPTEKIVFLTALVGIKGEIKTAISLIIEFKDTDYGIDDLLPYIDNELEVAYENTVPYHIELNFLKNETDAVNNYSSYELDKKEYDYTKKITGEELLIGIDGIRKKIGYYTYNPEIIKKKELPLKLTEQILLYYDTLQKTSLYKTKNLNS